MAKDAGYYHNPRVDLIGHIPRHARRILDVGCGAGEMAAAIKKDRPAGVEIVGIEVDPDAAAMARDKVDRLIIGDAEEVPLPFGAGYFDCIIYGDALEHLRDPWKLLAGHCECLRGGGCVIASIPNIAHYRVLKMLRKKEWEYKRSGILDETHLRFFAIKSIRRLFSGAGLEIVRIEHIISASRVKKFLNMLFRNLLIDDITEQYIIVAEKPAR